MIKGVMFDFSGTLFRCEPIERWLRAVVTEAGYDLTEDELAACAGRLAEAGAQPGGPPPRQVPSRLRELWAGRDLSAEQHRAAFTAMADEAGLPAPELAGALYDRHRLPAAWQPYPDAEDTLRELRGRGVPVAVVSNIGWDLRPVFRHHGLDPLIGSYVLSFEHGAKKPDPALFRAAVDLLAVPPGDVLMVGDDRRADIGAAELGCQVLLVDPLPTDQRPSALADVLKLL